MLAWCFFAALAVGCLLVVVRANADSWLGLPPAGMEMGGHTAGRSGVARESKPQTSIRMRILFFQHQLPLCLV